MIVSLSGGLDSAAMLGVLAADAGHNIQPVTFRYGSKHGGHEINAAVRVAAHYGLMTRVIDLGTAFGGVRSNLLIAGGPIPEGHYQAESMKATVVPGRNLTFAAVLAALAESEGHASVYMGAHTGDHAIYPDCRPEFFRVLNAAVAVSSSGRVRIETPLLGMDKADIVRLGLEYGVPFHLTRTCYSGEARACGKCGSCQERLEAFAKNGKEDPIEYQSRDIMPKE